MDKRYQVFVSSTYQDLAEERAAVIQAILGLDHFPAGMELFPAANDDQWTLIQRVIDESDYYVVVVAGRYGSVSAEGISYTEREYDYAVEIGVPILGFVHGDPDKIEGGKLEPTETARKKLATFREKVMSRVVKQFTSPAELGGHVTTALIRAIKDNPRVGWVRGDKAMTEETEREILRLRAELAEAREKSQTLILEHTQSIDRSTLAQGDDDISMPLRVWSKDYYDNSSVVVDATVSWNDILAAIGPVMIDEATEAEVEEKLEVCLYYGKMSEDDRAAVNAINNRAAGVDDDDFETVLVHFRSLGIIESGIKKRVPSDTNRYLRLTPIGVEKLAALKVVAKKENEEVAAEHPPVKKAPAKKAPAKKASSN
ncbi:hypothetical protein AU184_04720 [Mycolicibacterium novocastrense]|uniref:DUF4062 domain-containing protein n=1 Tax=Mycolicibacterium novocastrense TaxID=59813 RepID=UPI000746182C|nr:DUF4062 domain-containing protein [Mycolicibacterium novocastrense]KUH73186.1 hypothetical protein AU072_00925 [Mycolicibacterium novocastrense]KUH74269.1 hypothetical protein AU183_12920 [Mycolicibacterium novocastrense]KUH75272.1 hypothetical protein AU184_04720 [Mycolicibacterium novocastrense]